MTHDDLTEWLLRQIAEDEAVARGMPTRPRLGGRPPRLGETWRGPTPGLQSWLQRISPARVLDECHAKRKLVELHAVVDVYAWNPSGYCRECSDSGWVGSVDGHSPVYYPCPTSRLLALPYADRPGYREEWRP